MIKILKKASITIIGLLGVGVCQGDGAKGEARRVGWLPEGNTKDRHFEILRRFHF